MKMTSSLCWQIKHNGKFCKNYNLQNYIKCRHHLNNIKLNILLLLKLIIVMMYCLLFHELYNDILYYIVSIINNCIQLNLYL